MNSDRAQAKPSTDRCSYQASGRRECGAREQRPRPHDDCRTATEPRKPSAVNMPPGCLSGPKKPAVAAGCAGPARRQAGRDAQGSSTSRQLPVVSPSGAIPAPQRRQAVRDRGCTGAPSEVGLATRPSFEFGPARTAGSEFVAAQAMPSTLRCSGQPSGRRECASSLSVVRSRG